jgi:acyl-CoA reductase-like NAD-dependent aldehyde dehydrogenase
LLLAPRRSGPFFHQGQICFTTRRIIIQRGIYEEFLSKFVARANTLPGRPSLGPKTIIGPIVTHDTINLVETRVKEALARGRERLLSGLHRSEEIDLQKGRKCDWARPI